MTQLVLYTEHLVHEIITVSLPGDDLELISNCLKSLETRTDVSWRVFDEADLRSTVNAAAQYRQNGMVEEEEPFSFYDRLKALADHWDALGGLPTRPELWDKESDFTFLPPLIDTPSSGDQNSAENGNKLSLNAEQSAAADKIYQSWLKKYKRNASYFKDHPPKPIGWVAVEKSELSIRNGWATILQDGAVQGSATRRLAADKAYKPIHDRLLWVPTGWKTPGEVDSRTEEEKELEYEEMRLGWDRERARRELQEKRLGKRRA